MMMKEKFIYDFIERTFANHLYVSERRSKDGPFEVTQAINSMIGLLIVPISFIASEKARESYNPIMEKHCRCTNNGSKPIINHIRNGFVHGHFKFLPDQGNSNEIAQIEIWDTTNNVEESFKAIIHVDRLKALMNDLKQKLMTEHLETLGNHEPSNDDGKKTLIANSCIR